MDKTELEKGIAYYVEEWFKVLKKSAQTPENKQALRRSYEWVIKNSKI